MKVWSATGRYTWRSEFAARGTKKSSAFGSNRPRAKFWLRVMTELRNRGIQDILIAVVDGLKGFPEAITSVFPKTVVQTCIVHLIRYSMHFATWKERRLIGAALRPIYQAESAAAAQAW